RLMEHGATRQARRRRRHDRDQQREFQPTRLRGGGRGHPYREGTNGERHTNNAHREPPDAGPYPAAGGATTEVFPNFLSGISSGNRWQLFSIETARPWLSCAPCLYDICSSSRSCSSRVSPPHKRSPSPAASPIRRARSFPALLSR